MMWAAGEEEDIDITETRISTTYYYDSDSEDAEDSSMDLFDLDDHNRPGPPPYNDSIDDTVRQHASKTIRKMDSPKSVFRHTCFDESTATTSTANTSTSSQALGYSMALDDSHIFGNERRLSSPIIVKHRTTKSLDFDLDFLQQKKEKPTATSSQLSRRRSCSWTVYRSSGQYEPNGHSVDEVDQRILQNRRYLCESSVRQLYEDRKDHIMEIFSETWLLTDALEDHVL